MIHSTKGRTVGEQVGIQFGPDDIHIMNKMFKGATNIFEGIVTDENTISFFGVSFERENLGLNAGETVRLEIVRRPSRWSPLTMVI